MEGHGSLDKSYILPCIATGLGVGAGIGYFWDKSGHADTGAVRANIKYNRGTLLQTGLAFAGTSSLVFAGLSHFRPVSAPQAVIGDVVSSLVGGGLIGAGAYLASSTPDLVLVQLGKGTPHAWTTYAGGLAASLTYVALYTPISDTISSFSMMTLPSVSDHLSSFGVNLSPTIVSTTLGVSALAAAFSLQKSCTESCARDPTKPGTPAYFQLNPLACRTCPVGVGIYTALLQVPSWMYAGALLGASRGFVTAALSLGTLVRLPLDRNNPLFKYMGCPVHFSNLWGLALHVGIPLGALISSRMNCNSTDDNGDSTDAVKAMTPSCGQAFLGGFIMLFGALIAGGGDLAQLSAAGLGETAAILTLDGIVGGAVFASKVL